MLNRDVPILWLPDNPQGTQAHSFAWTITETANTPDAIDIKPHSPEPDG